MSEEENQIERALRYCEECGAHSNSRSGISDYNDGANNTDYLGNDDQNLNVGVFDSGRHPLVVDKLGIGQVAYGNLG